MTAANGKRPHKVHCTSMGKAASGLVRKEAIEMMPLASLKPASITRILDDAIQSVIDMQMYEQERRHEEDDALQIDAARQRAMLALGDFRTSPDGGQS